MVINLLPRVSASIPSIMMQKLGLLYSWWLVTDKQKEEKMVAQATRFQHLIKLSTWHKHLLSLLRQ